MAQVDLFELAGVSMGYGESPVVKDLDLKIRRGERIAIMGPSGAGKSTLLSLLYDLRASDIALIPQSASLVKPLSVFHNVYMGRLDRNSTAYNVRNLLWPAPGEVRSIRSILDEVGLAPKIFEPAGELSGGQQQRTSVARAIFSGRPIILGDEPVSALDRVQARQILELLMARAETVVLVLHDIHLALEYADRILLLDDGRLILDSPTDDLEPADLVARFSREHECG